MVEIDRYLLDLLRRQLHRAPEDILAPAVVELPAAALFADISGFTQIAERLAARGPAGAEELTRFLDLCFGDLIALIVSHGGDVLKFAGDGLLASWVPQEEDLATATLRAARCALDAQAALHGRPIGADTRLTLRIAVGAGVLCHSSVGGHRRDATEALTACRAEADLKLLG